MVRVVRCGPEAADEDLRLRALRFVDEDETPSFGERACRLSDGVGDARAFGKSPREPLGEVPGAARLDVAREAQRDVPLDEVGLVRSAHVVFRDVRECLARAGRASGVRVTREHRASERLLGEAAVAVARLDELRERLAAEAFELVDRERRLRDERGEQVHERAEVPLDDLSVDGRRRRGDVGRKLCTEAVELVLDVVRRVGARASAQHAERELRRAFLAGRVGRGAAAERDRNGYERDVVRLGDVDRATPCQLEPRDARLLARSGRCARCLAHACLFHVGLAHHCAASSSLSVSSGLSGSVAAPSGSTRMVVRAFSTRYLRAALRRSPAVMRR